MKRNSMNLITIGLAGLFLLTSACATVGNPNVINEELTTQIIIGESTKEDVRRLFGEPTTVATTMLNGVRYESWGYGYAKHETNPLLYVPLVGLIVLATGNGYHNEGGSLGASFDQNGIVRSFTKSQHALQGTGLGSASVNSAYSSQGTMPYSTTIFSTIQP